MRRFDVDGDHFHFKLSEPLMAACPLSLLAWRALNFSEQ